MQASTRLAGRLRLQVASWGFGCRQLSTEQLPDNLLPVVAVIGRPNVGKSALFNRLVRRREALVHNTPGGHVTRDYQDGRGQLADLRFRVIDTSGLEPFQPGDTIQARATQLTARVLSRSDLALMLVDGQTGVLPADEQLARWLRRTAPSLTIVPVANKCERRGPAGQAQVAEVVAEVPRLGFGEAVAISAETGEGMTELYAALQPTIDRLVEARQAAVRAVMMEQPGASEGTATAATSTSASSTSSDSDDTSSTDSGSDSELEAPSTSGHSEPNASSSSDRQAASRSSSSSSAPLKIAIMGLPNVGKSTLTNWLLQEERCLTGPEPGLTRDAIKAHLVYQGQPVELVDTAGWIRRTKLSQYDNCGGAVAAQTVEEGRTVLQFVHVVALVVDAVRALEHREGLTHREVTLASQVVEEGRALAVVMNKLDALTAAEQREARQLIQRTLEATLPEVSGVPLLGMSALTGAGAGALLPTALELYQLWNRRVPTSKLNRWVEQKAAEYGRGGGSEVGRVRFLSQVKARPPTFVASVGGSSPFPTTAQRFLVNLIRRQWRFGAVPLRLLVRYRKRAQERQAARRQRH